MEGRRLRPFRDSAFRHGCCREGGGREMMPPPLTTTLPQAPYNTQRLRPQPLPGRPPHLSRPQPREHSDARLKPTAPTRTRLRPASPPSLARSRSPSNRETSQGPQSLPRPASRLQGACAVGVPEALGVAGGLEHLMRSLNYPEVPSLRLQTLCPGRRKCSGVISWRFLANADSAY